MTFWRRFRTYLIGVGLGLLIVYVIFGDRELNTWTPENRIMTTIDSSTVSISARAVCQLKCLGLEDKKWVEIQHASDINFSESNAQKKPCPVYRLENKFDKGEYTMIWEVCENEERVEMLSVSKEGKSCDC
ncbi:hypothetical protein N8371_08010 [Vicingaceae bacterium]|nr:hypothetical protein [Vicingaceae bacterium]MDC1452333.1 hypothetical protein [Vicingaceae bacterium]